MLPRLQYRDLYHLRGKQLSIAVAPAATSWARRESALLSDAGAVLARLSRSFWSALEAANHALEGFQCAFRQILTALEGGFQFLKLCHFIQLLVVSPAA